MTTAAPFDPVATAEVAARLRPVRMVAAAFAASVTLYTLVAWFLVGRAGRPALGAGLPAGADIVGAGVAGILILLSTRVRVRLAAAPRGAGPQTQAERVARYQRAVIVGLAMREAVAIVGLVLALLTGRAAWAYGLGGIAFLAILAAWPRVSEVERAR